MLILLIFFLFYSIPIKGNDYILNSREQHFLNYMLTNINASRYKSQFRGTLHPRVKEIIKDAQNFTSGDKKCLNNPACFIFQGPPLTGKSRSAHVFAHTINRDTFCATPEVFFVDYSELMECKTLSIPFLKTYFEEIRKRPKKCVILIPNIERLFFPLNEKTYQYQDILNALYAEIKRCNSDPDRKIYIIATSYSFKLLPQEIRDIFNSNIIYFDYPDEDTRRELFFIAAEKKGIQISEPLALELAKKTYGYTLLDIDIIATSAKEEADPNPVTEQAWRQACKSYLNLRTFEEFKLAKMERMRESNHPWSFRERSRSYFSTFFKKIALVVGVLVALGFFFFKTKSVSRVQVYR